MNHKSAQFAAFRDEIRSENGERRRRDEGGDRGAAGERGVQDLEEEHTVPLRFGRHSRARVAVSDRGMAARPGGAAGQGLLRPEDDSRHPHLRG